MSFERVPSGDFNVTGNKQYEGTGEKYQKTDIDKKISNQIGRIFQQHGPFSDSLKLESRGSSSTGISRVAEKRFRAAAAEKGMSKEEIDSLLSYIFQNFDRWIAEGESVRIKKGGSEGLARTIEFIPDSNTVVTHFKRKNITGIKQPLGEGAHAIVKHSIVVVSRQLAGGAEIADKVPKDRTRIGVEKLIREGRLTQQLSDSPHVRGCYRVNHKGILLEGMAESMSTVMKRGMSHEVKVEAIRGIARGMAHIHEKGYVHQDLHMGNCFVSSEGIWKVGDLGSTQRANEINIQPVNLTIGSPDQMSAKIYGTNAKAVKSDDIWALGIMFYEIETGSIPSFMNRERNEAIQEARMEMRSCLEEINMLSAEERKLIFNWIGGEFEVPEYLIGKSEMLQFQAQRFSDLKNTLRELHQSFLKDVAKFRKSFKPQTDFQLVIRKMLDPDVLCRIDAAELLEFTENFFSGSPSSNSKFQETYMESSESASVYFGEENTDFTQVLKKDSSKGIYEEDSQGEDQLAYYDGNDSVELVSGSPEVISESEQLTKAVQEGDIDILRAILECGCDVAGWRDAQGCTLLHYAAKRNGNVPVVNFLLDRGADPNAADYMDNTPLHACALYSNIPAGMALIRQGGDPEAKNAEGKSPMDLAEHIIFLDDNKLLAAPWSQTLLSQEPIFIEWYKNQAAMLQFLEETPGVTEEAKQKLLFLSLQAFSKAASFGPSKARKLQMLTTPLFPEENRYHRGVKNTFVKAAEIAIAMKIRQYDDFIRIVDSPLVMEVLAREYSDSGELLTVSKPEDVTKLGEFIATNLGQSEIPPIMLIDFSPFLKREGDFHSGLEKFSQLWMAQDALLKNEDIAPVAVFNHEGQDVLLMPFYQGRILRHRIDYVLKNSGFIPSPDETKVAQAKNTHIELIFPQMQVGKAAFTTGIHAAKSAKMPIVCESMEDLLSTNAAINFEALASNSLAPPYQKVLSEGTVNLLRGFLERGLEAAYKEEGIQDLLQLSYFKIIDAMGHAVHHKESISQFQTQIEIIHQEMQNMLAILSIRHGYGPDEFAEAAAAKLTGGDRPIVPDNLGTPRMTLKASAIRCLSSTLTATERQKGSHYLNIMMQKGVYYESVETLQNAKNYAISTLDGELFRIDPSSAGFEAGKEPVEPVDLFICEIRHNISVDRTEYNKEDVAGQILAMKQKGVLADRCTVMIDTTIDLERSTDVRDLFENPDIQELILNGELNIVVVRSGQKFDMLGMDNYYGGITATINNGRDYVPFNERMEHEEDQLGVLSYQGMTHLQKFAGESTESYRQALMDNTQLFYDLIPEVMIAREKNENPIQVSKMNDGRSVFLDVKCPKKYRDLAEKFMKRFNRIAEEKNIPVTGRPSFGFPITNTVMIVRSGVRINPGLEKKEDIEKLAAIFSDIQDEIEEAIRQSERLPEKKVIKRVKSAVVGGMSPNTLRYFLGF